MYLTTIKYLYPILKLEKKITNNFKHSIIEMKPTITSILKPYF